MRALIGVKRVIDYSVSVRVNADKTGVVKDSVRHSCNPFDEIAAEQAVRMKEAGLVKEIVALSVGGPKSAEPLSGTALALGADRAIHVKLASDEMDLEPLAVAKIFQKITEDVQPDIVLLGKQAIDGDNGSTPQMLAGLMNWPQATFCSEIEKKDSTLVITREVDAGLQRVTVPLPAVLSVDLRLNEPRFPSLPNIMKARKKPMQTIPVEELGIDVTPRLEVVEVVNPPTRDAGVVTKTVEELVDKLKNEAKVL